MDKVELRNRLTPVWFVIVAAKLGIGGLVLGAGLIGLARGNMTSAVWTGLAVGAGVMGMGLFDLRLLVDRRVQITLTAEGLLDHRMRRPVLLPWARVKSIHHGGAEVHTLHFEVSGLNMSRFTGPGTAKSLVSGTTIDMQLDHVDVSHDEIERLVHHFAPDVVISGIGQRPRDGRVVG